MPRAVIGSFSLATGADLLLGVPGRARLRGDRACLGCGAAGSDGRWSRCATTSDPLAAIGLSPARVKLTAFAMSGAIAGFAGGLLAGLYVTFGPDRFGATESLQAISIVVIGGLASVTGAVLGAMFVVGHSGAVLQQHAPFRSSPAASEYWSCCCSSRVGSPRSSTRCATRVFAWRRPRVLPAPIEITHRRSSDAPVRRLAFLRRRHRSPARRCGSRTCPCGSGRSSPSTTCRPRGPGRRDRRPHRLQRRGQVDAHERHRWLRAEPRTSSRYSAPTSGTWPRHDGPGSASAARSRVPSCSATSTCARPSRSPSNRASTPAIAIDRPRPSPSRTGGASQAGPRRRDHRLPGPRRLCRTIRQRAVDRHPPHHRAGLPDRVRRRAAVPRRAHRRPRSKRG